VTFPAAPPTPRRSTNRPARISFALWIIVVLLPPALFAISLATTNPSGGRLEPLVAFVAGLAISLVVSLAAIVFGIVAVRRTSHPRTLAVWALVLNIAFCPIVTVSVFYALLGLT